MKFLGISQNEDFSFDIFEKGQILMPLRPWTKGSNPINLTPDPVTIMHFVQNVPVDLLYVKFFISLLRRTDRGWSCVYSARSPANKNPGCCCCCLPCNHGKIYIQ